MRTSTIAQILGSAILGSSQVSILLETPSLFCDTMDTFY